MLYECKENFVSLSKEIHQLENFINLNELQIEDRGRVAFNVDGDYNGYKVAPLIMTVFVENAFKHSQSSQSDKIEITIDLHIQKDGKLHFGCINTFSETANNANLAQGIGLENVKKRLELIYPDAYKLELILKEGKYIVDLQLDLKKGEQL